MIFASVLFNKKSYYVCTLKKKCRTCRYLKYDSITQSYHMYSVCGMQLKEDFLSCLHRGWPSKNSTQLGIPETQSRICITLENSSGLVLRRKRYIYQHLRKICQFVESIRTVQKTLSFFGFSVILLPSQLVSLVITFLLF